MLAPVHGRSFTAFRFSFREFGKHLRAQQFWFEYAILRSSVVDNVVGGASFVQRKLQHLFMTSTESFQSVGTQIDDLGHGPQVIFARNTNVIVDMAAATECNDLKGASGVKPCPKCANGVMKGSLSDADNPLPNPDNVLVEITATPPRDFVPNTNEALWETVDGLRQMNNLVRDKVVTKKSFKFVQQACGLQFNPSGLLADEGLRIHFKPLDVHTEDWSHVYLCKGIGV